MINGTGFVDISTTYATVTHRLLIQQLYNTIQNNALCRVIQNLWCNRNIILCGAEQGTNEFHLCQRGYAAQSSMPYYLNHNIKS